MSPEALLLLALFILLPLIERWLRSAQQRAAEAATEPAESRPRESRAPIRGVPPLPPLPNTGAEAPRPAAPPPPPRAPRRPAARRLPVPDARRAAGKAAMVDDLRHPDALRRAVVQMTILGPCRSVAPYDFDDASGRLASDGPTSRL